jgi:hypothetical protein
VFFQPVHRLVNDVFHLLGGQVVFLCQPFIGRTVEKPVTQNQPMPFVENPLVNKVLQFRP